MFYIISIEDEEARSGQESNTKYSKSASEIN